MNPRFVYLLFLLLISCRIEHSWSNVEDLENVKVGMNEGQVREIMTLEPLYIMNDDSLYYKGRWVYSVKKLVYDTPYLASSGIIYYFDQERDTLFYVFHDL